MKRLIRDEGQVTVLTAIFLVALLGLTGIVLDVGSWFRQQRVVQATVDAAALAGAASLPTDPGQATSDATTFANKNGGVAGASITIGTKWTSNDMITVDQAKPADGFFSKVFGISTVTVRAHASAVAEVPTAVWGAAPIVVDIHHQELSGPGCPCFGVPTTIPLGKKGVPGAFGMIDFDGSNGTTGASTLASWVANGYQRWLTTGDYYDSDPGAKFSNNSIQAALASRYGSDILFPVYDSLSGTGANAPYHIIAWAAFHVTLTQASGNTGTISGWFDRVIWQGEIPPSGPPNPPIPDLGVYTTALID